MSHVAVLAFAMLLDAKFGEPKWLWSKLPHPAVLMGRAVHWLDETLNFGDERRAKGIVAMIFLVTGMWVLGAVLAKLPAAPIVECLIAAILLAHGSLVAHVRAVATGLRQTLPLGRHAVSLIVSRDTNNMDEAAVARSAIESAAENFSDGVIAPAFWFLVFGLPGLLVYKMTNTADSMIGYKTPRYAEFGWAAARFDDLLNLIPARLTALLILLAHFSFRAWPVVRRDARLHRSPNAGWPEAAMAGTLGIALAGPRQYDGTMRDFPFVNPDGRRNLNADDISDSIAALWRSWAVTFAIVLFLAVV